MKFCLLLTFVFFYFAAGSEPNSEVEERMLEKTIKCMDDFKVTFDELISLDLPDADPSYDRKCFMACLTDYPLSDSTFQRHLVNSAHKFGKDESAANEVFKLCRNVVETFEDNCLAAWNLRGCLCEQGFC